MADLSLKTELGNLTSTLLPTRYITMFTTGTVAGPATGTTRYYPPGNVAISNVIATLSQASSTDFVFKINKNGTLVNTYTVTANSHVMSKTSVTLSLTTTDYLTVDLVSGSGSDLRLDLEYK